MELDALLNKTLQEKFLSKNEILYLLSEKNSPQSREKIYETARRLRERHFGNKIFLYAFIYFTTYCRNSCSFCYFRRENDIRDMRYRKPIGDIVASALSAADSGVHLIDLTMGEDPYYLETAQGRKELAEIVKETKDVCGLPIMISPGIPDDTLLAELKKAGACWYACYQETFDRKCFQTLRVGQDYDMRIQAKKSARSFGYLIEEGILTGIGETDEMIADGLIQAASLHPSQIRNMTFVPQPGTPLERVQACDSRQEVFNIALMRLLFPDCLVPASLDVEGTNALSNRLHAGANVITSIIPSHKNYAGVAQASLDIDNGHRSVEYILPILEQNGLRAASKAEYRQWLRERLDTAENSPCG